MTKNLILTLLLGTFLGCGSLQKTADRQFQAGQYIAAAATYEQILIKRPNDGKAQERLLEARRHILEDRLLVIRQLRMSENFGEALDNMALTIQQEKKWQVAPTGAAAATQTEEIEMLFRWFDSQIHNDLNSRLFLKAKIFSESYKDIFLAGEWRRKEMALANLVGQSGMGHCTLLKQTAHGPYAKEFVNRYCIFWGQSNSAAKAVASEPLASHEVGFSRIHLLGSIAGMTEVELSTLSQALLDGLQKTPFYDPSGGELKVNLQGEFKSDYQEHPILALHSYQVQIPYQDSETVSYQESEPFTNYRTHVDPQTGRSSQEPYTDYRYVTKYRQEYVTRYRSEERSFNYPATEFNAHYSLRGKVSFNIDYVPHDIPLNEQLEIHDSYHEAANAQIGLYAKPKEMLSSLEWLKYRFKISGGTLAEQVSNAWDTKYCQVPVNLRDRTQIESVMKCIKGTTRTHDFVENWFKSKFGLPYKVVGQTIGFGV